MKKSIIILCSISIFFATTLKAQTDLDARENFILGAKVGLNSSNVWDESGQDFAADAKIGLAAGVFFGIPLNKVVGFQPELLISQKGFQGSGTLITIPYSYKLTTTYLDIPLQVQIKPIEFLTIVAGPQYSYLINSKTNFTVGDASSEVEQAFENENIRKNILGFVLGADVNLSFLVISGRLGWDFLKNNGDGTSVTPRYRNQWIQLTVGARI